MGNLGNRLKEIRGHKSRDEFAAQFAVHRNTLAAWEKELTSPDAKFLTSLCLKYNISPLWLLLGQGTKSGEEQNKDAESQTGVWLSTHSSILGGIPVLNLVESDTPGWNSKCQTAITAQRPAEYMANPHIFVVIASGNTLRLEGVRQGYLCYCDPRHAPDIGDIVYVERKDKKADLKQFISRKGSTLTLQTWEDNDQEEIPMREEISLDNLNVLATVIYVKRKL